MNFFGSISEKEARNVNPLVLAYIGDAVHSLVIRESLVRRSDAKAGKLHEYASDMVNAHSQSLLADKVFSSFTEEERDVYMRGRNGKSGHTAKNQTKDDYRKATGLEAVLGYLYLKGDEKRILEIVFTEEKC